MIMQCGCDGYLGNKAGAKFQDAIYGAGKRVFNKIKRTDGMARCSVCGTERRYRDAAVKDKDKDAEASEKTKK